MAKTPNQSDNDRPLNALAELGERLIPSTLKRALSRDPSDSQRYAIMIQQMQELEANPLLKLSKSQPTILSKPEIADEVRRLEERLQKLRDRVNIAEESRGLRIADITHTAIARSFDPSAVNAKATRLLESPELQQKSLRLAGEYSRRPEALQEKIARSSAQMNKWREEAESLQMADIYGDVKPESQQRLYELFGKLSHATRQHAAWTGASRVQRLQGIDAPSQYDRWVALEDKAKDIAASRSGDVQKLAGMSSADLRRKEADAINNLVTAMDALRGATDEERTEKEKGVRAASEEFQNIQRAKAMGGGGGGPSGWAIAQGGFNAAAMAIQQIGVNQRLGQMGNVAGYANFQNQMYQTYKAAQAGDVASLLMLPQFQAATDFGGSLGTAAQAAVIARGAAGVAQAGAGLTEGGATLNPFSDLFNSAAAVNSLKVGAQDIIGGTATTAEAGFDLARGVSRGQADIAGRQARLSAARELMANMAEQMQGFRDFGVGMGTAAMGMGRGGEAFLRGTVNADFLGRMAGARIAPEQFAQMAQFGVNQMGSGFNQEQIFGARALERRGLGSMQENMQRMSALYMAGANNPQEGLGRILEAAIPRGFDNSKLVGQLVQYSSQMAQQAGGVATGLNMTTAAASLLTSGLTPTTENREALLEHAVSVAGGFRSAETNTSASYRGMLNVGRMMRATGTGIGGIIAAGLPIEQLMSLRDTDWSSKPSAVAARQEAFIKAGLDPNTTRGQLGQIIRGKQLSDLDIGETLIGAKSSDLIQNMSKAGSYAKMSVGDRFKLGQIAQLGVRSGVFAEGTTGEDIYKREMGIATSSAGTTGKGVFTDATVGKLQKSMDDLRTQGFVQLSAAAGNAAKELDKLAGAGKGIDALAAMFKIAEGTIGATEKAAPTAAARAAKGGPGFDTAKWDAVADKLNTVLNRIITRQGGAPVPSQRPEVPQ